MAENTREIVLDILLALEREEDFSHRLIRAVLNKYDYLEERDKAFIKRLTEGTIERQIELDYDINQCSSVPVRKMKPLIRCLMRMSVYQLLYMDNVPDSAVCNEACKLAQKRKFANLKGFVNGVLRSVARQKTCLALPNREREPILFLSVKYSMPEWIVELWIHQYGEACTEQILEGLLAIHPVSLRFRTDWSEEEKETLIAAMGKVGVRLKPSKRLPYLYLIEHSENLTQLPGYEEGGFMIQDASSALAVEAADIGKDDFVIDICAAPGGKTILAAERADRVLARDVSQDKVRLIEENIERMQRKNIQVQVHDATEYDETLYAQADVMLADVPCSGLGVIGKKRDIKYRMTPEKIRDIVALQRRILESSWQYVKPGGVLLYSTCTVNPAENEETARWLTQKFPFVLEEERQFLPGIDETDGFYYARLRREA